jgi:hypothetical protein
VEKQIWVRRDRETGEETEMSFDDAKAKLKGYYSPVVATMETASKDNCMTTGFADYYPLQEEQK